MVKARRTQQGFMVNRLRLLLALYKGFMARGNFLLAARETP